MNTETIAVQRKRRFSGLQVLGIVFAAIAITILTTVLVFRFFIFPDKFRSVSLNAKEEQVLETKLRRLEGIVPALSSQASADSDAPLEPEAYSEEGASREIRFTEKELNALIARNTDLASRLAIDLSDNLASARLLIPLDEDFPVLGGKTVKVSAGMALSYLAGRPVVVLKGVSLMGVPVPNAWLGNLKNVDLVEQFGDDRGFWAAFADGVELIEVRDGQLHLELKE